MEIDPGNRIVQLCTEGMNAEFEGKLEESGSLFNQAWELAADDFEAFIAAHYMARRQLLPEEKLRWNLESFHLASKINDEGIKKYLPSLCLNVGKSYEDLRQNQEAIHYYQLGAGYAEAMATNAYGNMIKSGLSEGLKRMNVNVSANQVLDALINQWCERKDLKPLAFVLAAYVGNLGSALDKQKIISALSYLSATQCLNDEEQQKVEQLIIDMQHEIS